MRFLTLSASRLIHSISRNVCLSLYRFVSSDGTRNRVDWRFLVKERNAKITKLCNPFFGTFGQLFMFLYFLGVLCS